MVIADEDTMILMSIISIDMIDIVKRMSYFLVVITIVAIIAIVFFWFISKKYRWIPDDEILSLEGIEDKVLQRWYDQHMPRLLLVDMGNYEIAAALFEKLQGLKADPKKIVIGHDLAKQYEDLLPRESNNKIYPFILDIRSQIGKPGEIAIVTDDDIRKKLRANNDLDMRDVYGILENQLEQIARDYLKEILQFRWNKLIEVRNANLLNRSGSFAYFRTDSKLPPGSVTMLFPNVTAAVTRHGARVNLLCSDLEFTTLLTRMTQTNQTLVT
jgi:vacuolar-type H+-ATPase subunit F/Vma7